MSLPRRVSRVVPSRRKYRRLLLPCESAPLELLAKSLICQIQKRLELLIEGVVGEVTRRYGGDATIQVVTQILWCLITGSYLQATLSVRQTSLRAEISLPCRS